MKRRSQTPVKRDDDKRDFATKVLDVYRATLERKPLNGPFSHDVRRVAFGLVALRQATDHFFDLMKNDRDIDRLPQSGIAHASAIIDALTSGHDHPVWRHIAGLQSAAFRPGRAPASQSERERQAMAGALTLAYAEASQLSLRAAASAVIKGVISLDFSFTDEQLRKWALHEEAPGIAREYVVTAASISDNIPFAEKVMIVGRTQIYRFWSAPASVGEKV